MLNFMALHFNLIRHNKFFQVIGYFSWLIFVLLNGCSTVRKDGPPSYQVDVSHIPDAVPKAEPLSRWGNKSYTVFGRRYYVMYTSKNYEQRGIASWYGTKFHGHSTSNGERYNMLAMTAAHKTLPLPTYVEVTNLKNGRKVTVKVTDRGPFENNRLIDLSYAAAKKLDILGHGTAPVNVKAIDPLLYDKNYHASNHFFLAENTQKNLITVPDYTPHYKRPLTHPTYIQVGAFRNKVYAEKLKNRLESRVTSPVNLAHLNKLYHVQIGPIQDAISVAQINRQLRAMGIKSMA